MGETRLAIKLFADGADIAEMAKLSRDPSISGFTTNPTLMRKAGVRDYEGFARAVLNEIQDKPISFEVFADDFDEMIAQGRVIAGWAPNIHVKIPVTDTKGAFAGPVITALSREGIALNVTAVMTFAQVERVAAALDAATPSIVSVFAGRIADTGVDPIPHMVACREILRRRAPRAELLWASPRELLNIFHAEAAGCDIITATGDLLAKLTLVGKDLTEYSLETVQMFERDAARSEFHIRT